MNSSLVLGQSPSSGKPSRAIGAMKWLGERDRRKAVVGAGKLRGRGDHLHVWQNEMRRTTTREVRRCLK